MRKPVHPLPLLSAFFLVVAGGANAQTVNPEDGLRVERIEVEPSSITVGVGESLPFRVTAYDADGTVLHPELRATGPRQGMWIENDEITGLGVGRHEMVVSVLPPIGAEGPPATVRVPVEVTWPGIERVEVQAASGGPLYSGTHVQHRAQALHADGSVRPDAEVEWSVSDPALAAVDAFGRVVALGSGGTVSVTAEVEGVRGSLEHDLIPLPIARLEVNGPAEALRTGDVVDFELRLFGSEGEELEAGEVPVEWSYTYVPDDSMGTPGAAAVVDDGRFVAQFAGEYTVWAATGPHRDWATVKVSERDAVRRIEVLGQGRVSHRRTSDFWVYEGVDGRDYAITGTWGSDGFAYFWDVTDPTNMVLTDSIQVDARTVNDVKVSPDGRYGVLTREGASDRRNGVVILDLAEPAHPTIASVYDDGLTGGVHNAFPTDDYLFALSAGEKYVILDVRDINDPRYVSEYSHPNSRVHDVWVEDGIAYSAEWRNGVVVVDVGNGRWGGTIEDPVFVTNYVVPHGNTHDIFPYHQESTGRFYLFLGDEIIGRQGYALEGGMNRAPYDPEVPRSGTPRNTAGYIHIVDFTDPENPQKVARYHVPEYGTHNIWIEDDILYQAYYEGGLRVVDISGPLMGNLYTQGREIAVFKPNDPVGYVANAPTTWSTMPFKGNVFLSDANSGLWSVKLLPRDEMVP